MAGVMPEEISYVEAHGTGTSLGDPIEIEALKQAFDTEKRNYCSIGSVKSNIGHLEAASGMAGLIKVLLMMRKGLIAPTINIEKINRIIDFENSPFRVALKKQDWEKLEERPYIAGISSFGFGGVNSHVILTSYKQKIKELKEQKSYPFTVSAKDEEGLQNLIKKYQNYVHLEESKKIDIGELCQKAIQGREMFGHRYGGMVGNTEELGLLLDNYENISRTSDKGAMILEIGSIKVTREIINQARDLYENNEFFKESVDGLSYLAGNIFQNNKINANRYKQIEFILLYGLSELFIKLGLKPDVIKGEKAGFLISAVIAGKLSLEEAYGWLTGQPEPKDRMQKIKEERGILFYDSITKNIIPDYYIKKDYLKSLRAKIKITEDEYEKIAGKAGLLLNEQYTFKNNVDEWGSLLNKEEWEIIKSNKAVSKEQKLIWALIVEVSLNKVNRKWNLSGREEIKNESFSELQNLVLDGIITLQEALSLIFNPSQGLFKNISDSMESRINFNNIRKYPFLVKRKDLDIELKSEWQKSWMNSQISAQDKENAFVLRAGRAEKETLRGIQIGGHSGSTIKEDIQNGIMQAFMNGGDINMDFYFKAEEENANLKYYTSKIKGCFIEECLMIFSAETEEELHKKIKEAEKRINNDIEDRKGRITERQLLERICYSLQHEDQKGKIRNAVIVKDIKELRERLNDSGNSYWFKGDIKKNDAAHNRVK